MALPTVKPLTLTSGKKSLLPDTEFVSGTGFYEFVTTANQTSTSTTYANVTELVTTSLPVGLYTFKVVATCQSTAKNTGIGLRIGGGGATLSTCVGKWFISQNANGTSQSYQYDQLTSTTNVTSASAAAANTNFMVVGLGVFRVTSAGTVAVQIRSETTTAVSIRADSVFQIKRVA